LFREYFPNFNFTSYEEGITNTINYYKKLIWNQFLLQEVPVISVQH
jgi:hypothetical protein